MLEGADALAPWEEEEAWSRPSKLAARSTVRRGARDEWDDAASNWRSWADEAADRVDADGDAESPAGEPVSDHELFARDREQRRPGGPVG